MNLDLHPRAPVMHVRCPHCHNPIEFVEPAEPAGLGEIQCPSCGSSFSLVESATTTYDSAGADDRPL